MYKKYSLKIMCYTFSFSLQLYLLPAFVKSSILFRHFFQLLKQPIAVDELWWSDKVVGEELQLCTPDP